MTIDLSRVFERRDTPTSGRASRVLFECRHCGTKARERPDRCENCGADEIARYELP